MVADIITLYPDQAREELTKSTTGPSLNKRQDTVPSITDLDARFREMDTGEPPRQVASLAILGRIYFL